jgi:YrbI family 3-deoxy-D-manno-octulosonate 8-phosphate phosphatase
LAGASVHDAIGFHGPIAALILDFDGVFTDNKVIVTDDGREAVVCDRSDGYAVEQLKRTGLPILILSTEKVPIVRFRCEKLGLECIHGVDDKAAALRQWLSEHNIAARQTVYVGNDVNDIGCMQIVGHPVAVADAFPEAIAAARYVLAASGGHGAVREIALALAQHLRKTG